jgi:hypothetical protein
VSRGLELRIGERLRALRERDVAALVRPDTDPAP